MATNKVIRAKRQPKDIYVVGRRDPRGPDNQITVWVDDQDRLHVRVLKADRCYRFSELVNEPGYVEVVQS